MNNKILTFALFTLMAASLSHAQWTSLISEDFESYSFGDQPAGNWVATNGSSSITNELVTDSDGGTAGNEAVLPGNSAGSGNALYYFDDSTSVARGGINFGDASQNYGIVQVSFDFSFVSLSGTETGSFGTIVLTDADNTTYGSPTSQAVSIDLFYDGKMVWDGGNTTLSNPTGSHTLAIVANGSNSSFSYSALDGSGDTIVASKAFDLYIDGSLLGSSIAFTTDIALGRFGITTFSSAVDAKFMIDNLGASTIPEPSQSSAVLAAIMALFVAVGVRRYRK